MWDLSKLRAFSAVARHQSVTKAAAELAISQSPLSRQIIALEEDLGFALFVREKRRIRLSDAGVSFFKDTQHILAAAEQAHSRAADVAAGRTGAVSIGYVDGAIHAGVVQKGLVRLRARVPGVAIRLSSMSSAEQASAIRSGVIDVGFAYRRVPVARGFPGTAARRVAEERFVVAVPDRGRWSTETSVATVFAKLPWIAGTPSSMRELAAGLERLGIQPTTGSVASDPSVVLALVATGEGAAVVGQSLRALAPAGVRFLPLPDRFSPRMRIFRTDRIGGSALVRWL